MTEKTISTDDKTSANPNIRESPLSEGTSLVAPSFIPLIPMLVFFVLFLGTGILLQHDRRTRCFLSVASSNRDFTSNSAIDSVGQGLH